MEPAERIGSGRTLGKRPRSRVLPRTASMVTVPSAAKQGRQERGAGVPASCSLPASGAGMGTGGGGAAPRGFFSGGYLAGAETTAAFLKACGLCNRRLGPGHDTFIYRFVDRHRSCLYHPADSALECLVEFPLFSSHSYVAPIDLSNFARDFVRSFQLLRAIYYGWLLSARFSTSGFRLDRISFPSQCLSVYVGCP